MSVPRTSDPATLFEAARGGDRGALARLLSLVERGGPASREVAGLVADGETVITDAHHVDRGYEELDVKLAALGAHVSRA